MATINLRAHFDGERILLDEPFELEPDTKLIVMVLPKEVEAERDAWLRLSKKRLKEAYDDDEVEYSSDLIKELNPEYERG